MILINNVLIVILIYFIKLNIFSIFFFICLNFLEIIVDSKVGIILI